MAKRKHKKKAPQKKNILSGSAAVAVNYNSTYPNKVTAAVAADRLPFYRKNMQALKQRYPELARRVETTVMQNFSLANGAPGKPVTFKDRYSNLNYYKAEDPYLDVKTQLEALNLKNTRLAVFLGLGLGYELLYYLSNMAEQQNTNFILVIEKDMEIFKTALQATDLSSPLRNGKITFMVGLPEEDLYVALRSYLAAESRFILLKAMKPVYHPSALYLNKGYYTKALKELRESGAHQLLHFGNDPHDSIIGIENMMENIDEIIFNPGINLLYNKFANKPGLVVATGPSLNKNKHLLRGLEDKALIVAADASLKILLEMGVKPHLVTSLERVPATVKLLEGFSPEEVKDVYFAGCPVVRKEAYEVYPGPRVIVYRNFDHFKWLNIDRGILDIQLSAGNMAFKLCEAMGCDPIILIGQDLAFSRDGLTHASGATYGEIQGQRQETLEVPGNDGRPILTTKTWYSFLKAYEIDISMYRGRCINSTEGGALIKGTEVRPFREAIEQHINTECFPLRTIKNELKRFSRDEADRDYDHMLDLIEKTRTDMEAITRECAKGVTLYNEHKAELIKSLSGNAHEKGLARTVSSSFKAILEPKNRITSAFGRTYQLYFMHVIQSFNIKFEMEMVAVPDKHDLQEKNEAEIALRHGEWYSVVGNLAKIMLGLLDKAETKLKGPGEDPACRLRRVTG